MNFAEVAGWMIGIRIIEAQLYLMLAKAVATLKTTTVEPLYSGHPWGTTFWPFYRGGLY